MNFFRLKTIKNNGYIVYINLICYICNMENNTEYVYFFRENNNPYVKIGRTVNELQIRFQNFKTYAPLGAYIVGCIKTSDCVYLEKKLHKDYAHLRVNGEFFHMDDSFAQSIISKYDVTFEKTLALLISVKAEFNLQDSDAYEALRKYSLKLQNQKKEIISPILLEFIENNQCVKLTATQIADRLCELGYRTTPYSIGRILKQDLGYQRKIKKVGKKTIAYYYFD